MHRIVATAAALAANVGVASAGKKKKTDKHMYIRACAYICVRICAYVCKHRLLFPNGPVVEKRAGRARATNSVNLPVIAFHDLVSVCKILLSNRLVYR